MKTRAWLSFPLFVAGIVGVQLVLSASGRAFYLTQLTMAVYYALVVLGLALLMGYAGQVSLGHGGFFALGGYVSAFITTHSFAAFQGTAWARALEQAGVLARRKGLFETSDLLTASPGAAFAAAMGLTLLVALVIGYPALRLKGHYLAMATLGFGLIVYRLLLGSPFLGAADGITGVPPWRLGFGLAVSGQSALRVQNYYLAWGVALVALALLANLVTSRMGRALRAIHDNETAANAMGVNTARIKLQAFVVSALLAAAAGSLLTHFNQGIGPSEASALKSVRYVALVAAGGMASLRGALIISTLLNVLSLRGVFGTYDNAVFGLLLIIIVSVAPAGPFRSLGSWCGRRLRPGPLGREAGHGVA